MYGHKIELPYQYENLILKAGKALRGISEVADYNRNTVNQGEDEIKPVDNIKHQLQVGSLVLIAEPGSKTDGAEWYYWSGPYELTELSCSSVRVKNIRTGAILAYSVPFYRVQAYQADDINKNKLLVNGSQFNVLDVYENGLVHIQNTINGSVITVPSSTLKVFIMRSGFGNLWYGTHYRIIDVEDNGFLRIQNTHNGVQKSLPTDHVQVYLPRSYVISENVIADFLDR